MAPFLGPRSKRRHSSRPRANSRTMRRLLHKRTRPRSFRALSSHEPRLVTDIDMKDSLPFDERESQDMRACVRTNPTGSVLTSTFGSGYYFPLKHESSFVAETHPRPVISHEIPHISRQVCILIKLNKIQTYTPIIAPNLVLFLKRFPG